MKNYLFVLLLAAGLVACDDSETPAASASASPSPTATPSSSPDPNATPAPSLSPAPTPSPTPVAGEKGFCGEAVGSGASAEQGDAGLGCIACSVADPTAVLTTTTTDFARMSTTLSVLGAGGESDLSLVIKLAETLDPTVVPMSEEIRDQAGNVIQAAAPIGDAPAQPGFVVSFPDTAAAVAILPELLVETYLGDQAVDNQAYGFGIGDSLALGTLIQDINNAKVYLPLQASAPYDQIRLSLTSTVLGGGTLSVDVHKACVSGVAGSISGDY